MKLLTPPYEPYEPCELGHFKSSQVHKVHKVRRGIHNHNPKGTIMTDNDDAQDQAEKLRQFFSVAQEFTNDFFDVMIKQIETFDCSDEELVIFKTFVARSNLATAADFLLEMEDNPQLVGEIAASRVNARNQRKKAEKMRLLN
jgi:hypothetical protein